MLERLPFLRFAPTTQSIFMASKAPKNSQPSAATAPATAPAEGERRALRGYVGQYERAGAAIYAALERDELLWIGVADRNAGIADDLVLGFDGLVLSLIHI